MACNLATANLHLTDILEALGVSQPREIFYKGIGLVLLKTEAELGALVNKLWLSSTYCPGATADERLSNLRTDRKLSYLKGYGYTDNIVLGSSYAAHVTLSLSASPESLELYSQGTQDYGYAASVGSQSASFTVTNFPAGMNLRLNLLVNGSVVSYKNFSTNGTFTISVPNAVSYPSTMSFQVISL